MQKVCTDTPRNLRDKPEGGHGIGPIQFNISLSRELKALEYARQWCSSHAAEYDDPGAILSIAHSETRLVDVVDHMLIADVHEDALIDGLRGVKAELGERLTRLEQRRASRRSMLEQVLFALETKRWERPLATLFLVARPASLVVEDEAELPAKFFDLKPMLNRKLAKEALEAGEEVPGARLSQGIVTLTVRRR